MRKAYIYAALLFAQESCHGAWNEGVWPASNHSPREAIIAYGRTNLIARDVWIMDCWSGMVERGYAVGRTNFIDSFSSNAVSPFDNTNAFRQQSYYMRTIKANLIRLCTNYLAASTNTDYGLHSFFLNPAGVSSNADGYPAKAYGWNQGFLGNLYSAASLGNGWETNVIWRDHNEMTTNNPGYGWDSVRRVLEDMTLTFGSASTVYTNSRGRYQVITDAIYDPPAGGPCASPPVTSPCAETITMLAPSALWPIEQYIRTFVNNPVGFCGFYTETSIGAYQSAARSRFGSTITTNIVSKIDGIRFFRWSSNAGDGDDAPVANAGSYDVIEYEGTYAFQTNAFTAISSPMNTDFTCFDPPSDLIGTMTRFETYSVSQVIVKWNFDYD